MLKQRNGGARAKTSKKEARAIPPSGVKQVYESFEDMDLRRHAQQLVCPTAETTVKFPALFPFEGTALTLKRVLTVESSGAGSQFALRLAPSLHSSLAVMDGEVDFPAGGERWFGTVFPPASSSGECYPGFLEVSSFVEKGVAHSKEHLGRQSWRIVNETAGNLNVEVRFSNDYFRAGLGICYTSTGGAAWVQTNSNLQPLGTANQTYIIVAGTTVDFAFAVTANVSVRLESDAGLKIPGTEAVVMSYISEDYMSSAKVERVRVAAMSMLATYTGSTLNNGGVIAAARLQPGIPDVGGNLYSALAKLPSDEYHGPLREGAYVWWLPRDLTEVDFSDGDESVLHKTSSSLAIAGVFTEADCSVEITVQIQFEFYTPLQLFEKRLFPMYSPLYSEFYSLMNSLPAASCNPSHWELLKKAITKGASGAAKLLKGGVEYGIKHPEVVSGAMKAFASLL